MVMNIIKKFNTPTTTHALPSRDHCGAAAPIWFFKIQNIEKKRHSGAAPTKFLEIFEENKSHKVRSNARLFFALELQHD